MATQKIAVRRLKRGSDGQIKIVYVDAKTQQELTSLIGYTIASQNELAKEDFPHGLSSMLDMPHGLGAIGGFPLTSTSSTTGNNNAGRDGTVTDTDWLWEFGGSGIDSSSYSGTDDRTQANNFGYIDKPGVISAASSLPGIAGLIGKGINAAINANNVAAVNSARSSLGLPQQSTKDTIKGVVQDNKGVVAEVTIGKQQVPIGLEATTPSGRTTMTPQEAQSRAKANNVEIQEATEEAKEEAEAKFAEEYGKQTSGFLGNLKDIVKEVIDPKGPLSGVKSPLSGVKSPLSGVKSPLSSKTGKSEGKSTGKTESKSTGKSTGIATPETAAPKSSITPGIGLGNLTKGKASTSGLAGKGRGVAPDQVLMDVIQQAVEQALGPGYIANITSGTYSPAQQQAIEAARSEGAAKGLSGKALDQYAAAKAGQVGTNRHTHGKAVDFQVLDPTGKTVKDTKALQAVAGMLAQLGITGLGLGPSGGYMGGTAIHADTVNPGKATGWGGLGQGYKGQMNEGIGLPNAFTGGIPTPSPNPGTGTGIGTSGSASGIAGVGATGSGSSSANLSTGIGSIQESIENAVENITEAIQNTLSNQQNTQGTQGTPTPEPPGQKQAPEENIIDQMAKAIAGELGSKTLGGIASGNPQAMEQARQEIAAIAGTMANRSNSSRHNGNMSSVLSGSQYNSLKSENLSTTNQNYESFGDFIKEAIEDFYNGTNPSPVPNATHYWNPSIVNPSWSRHARGPSTNVGEHTFADITIPGTNISEYHQGLPSTPGNIPTPTPNPGNTNGITGSSNGTVGVGASGSGSLGNSGIGLSGNGSVGAGIGGTGAGTVGFGGISGLGGTSGGTAGIGANGSGSVGYSGSYSGLGGFGSPSESGPGPGGGGSGIGNYSGTAQGSVGAGSSGSGGTQTGAGFGISGSVGGTAGAGKSGGGSVGYGGSYSGKGGQDSPSEFGPGPGMGLSPSGPGQTPSGVGGLIASVNPSTTMSSTFSHSFTSGYAGSKGTGSLGGLFGGSTGGSSSGSSSNAASNSSGNYSGAANSFSNDPGMGHTNGGGGGESNKVLCTYFYSIGKLPSKLYYADQLYASIYISDQTSTGYRLWAEPIVEYLKKSKHPILEKFLFFFVEMWASEMAYRIGVEPKSNLIGRQICNIGETVCGLIGKATRSLKRPLKENK